MTRGLSCLLVGLTMLGSACAGGGAKSPAAPVEGPPMVQKNVVHDHAVHLDAELPRRVAGSQDELAAASYILAHLQTAGYAPLLDPVPVKDLVRSTNVVAPPPGGDDPAIVVAVAYDTAPHAAPSGAVIGLWLELARSLRVRAPEHAVEFVALGAEHASVGGGDLGSRRLAELLLDDDQTPTIVTLGTVAEDGATFDATGSGAAELLALARRLHVATGVRVEPASGASGVFATAGFASIDVGGSIGGVGRVLLDYLATEGR